MSNADDMFAAGYGSIIDAITGLERERTALWDRISHDVWDDITRALGIDDYQAPADEIIAAIKRYREHSVTLNTIGWRVAQALGDVPDGATEIAGNPTGQIERLIADLAEERRQHGVTDTALRQAIAELHAIRPIVEAAKAWRDGRAPSGVRGKAYTDLCRGLAAAVEALDDPAYVDDIATSPDGLVSQTAGVYTMTAPAPELPGMWEVADLVGGQTDAQPDGR